jgi:predicted O-linked N-acetylglucosamine transferase (SPINDLY family)
MSKSTEESHYYIYKIMDFARSHLATGRLEFAKGLCRKVIELLPENLEAPYLLGKIAAQEGDYAAAADLIASIQTLVCDDSFLQNYYDWHRKANKYDRAVSYLRGSVLNSPGNYVAWFLLASVCLDLSDLSGFQQAAHRAGCLRPESSSNNYDLALLYEKAGLSSLAEHHLRICITVEQKNIYYLNGLAGLLKSTGRADEAVAYYRRLIVEKQNNALTYEGYTNFLMNFICTTTHTPEEVFAEHRQWGEQLCEQQLQFAGQFENQPAPDKVLRIGYVSSDFGRHPVSFFIEPLLSLHDQEQFMIFLYSNLEHEDDVTEQLKQRPVTWRQIFGRDDEEVVRVIREDNIDILVDLGGLTRKNRLAVFARRAAPVQVTWLGYAHSTGLPSMDYRITDAIADPPGMTEHLHTERLYRLQDCFLGYCPPINSPSLSPLPVDTAGYITFVAFNNLAKTNDTLLEWWATILKRVPGSRLLLKDHRFVSDSCFRNSWLDRFAILGITVDRLGLQDWSPTVHDHLELLSQGDIALDAYPYNGTTTTSEALWMGVPVVTLAGPSHVSRVSASLLSNVGVPELVSHSPEEYIENAVHLAGNRDRLHFYRANLRALMQASPLMDFEGFARKIEAAYRDIWEKWCIKQSGEDTSCQDR